ncbi:hypothetical protein V6Z12_D06G257100 [Gossypium hirsutum]
MTGISLIQNNNENKFRAYQRNQFYNKYDKFSFKFIKKKSFKIYSIIIIDNKYKFVKESISNILKRRKTHSIEYIDDVGLICNLCTKIYSQNENIYHISKVLLRINHHLEYQGDPNSLKYMHVSK